MEREPAEPWTVERLAERSLHIGPSHLAGLFRRHLGESPMAYLDRHRMERAAALLLGSDMTVGEVGRQVGIDDANYFTRRFRARFSRSPRAFRARERH